MEFDAPRIIYGIITQGRNGPMEEWVTSFKVQVSTDCTHYAFVKQNGAEKVNGTFARGAIDLFRVAANTLYSTAEPANATSIQ